MAELLEKVGVVGVVQMNIGVGGIFGHGNDYRADTVRGAVCLQKGYS